MKGWVTINTDAGFKKGVGSYAYWIKAEGLFLRGSGIFKNKCENSLDAEQKAIINAVHILLASKYQGIVKIVFNRDNIRTGAKAAAHPLQKQLAELLHKLKTQQTGHMGPNKEFATFRHVKAHSHKKTARHWVNDWCDQQCQQELKKYYQKKTK